jgi:hypothetical protein
VGTHRIVRYFCSMLLRSKGGSNHTITKLTSKCILLHRITGIHHLSMRLVPNEESQIWKPNHHVTPKCILTGLAPRLTHLSIKCRGCTLVGRRTLTKSVLFSLPRNQISWYKSFGFQVWFPVCVMDVIITVRRDTTPRGPVDLTVVSR